MVRLEKISMQGFKSFKRKAVIEFPAGLSVVTGPNGSGKSCMLDAISFVFGSATRTLRAKKLQELIFHGSKTKGGSDFAKVSVHFNNDDGKIPIKEKSLMVSRRINKAGVSTYRLNGMVVTKQQVQDIFSQSDVQINGYNIIQQGDVTKIVDMMPVQRRQIIDDISGISEYDEKKRLAKGELEKVEQKLRDAEIVLDQKDQIVERLKADRNAALKYRQFREELENVQASLALGEFEKVKEEIEELDARIEECRKKGAEMEKSIKEIDVKLSGKEEQLGSLTKDVMEAGARMEATNRIIELRSKIERARDRMGSNEREIQRLNDIIERVKSMSGDRSPHFLAELKPLGGVHGMLSSLISVPAKYDTAAEVTAGGHMSDIVVDTAGTAAKCINYLKERQIGRARFLPLDKIMPPIRRDLPAGAIGWMSDLLHNDPRFTPAVNYVFASTACVNDIEKAREIMRRMRVRMVTLDGDLVESSGAMTGGFYRKSRPQSADISKYSAEIRKLSAENDGMENEISKLNRELEKFATRESRTTITNIEIKRAKIEEEVAAMRGARRETYDGMLMSQQDINTAMIQKAKAEARIDTLKSEMEKFRGFDRSKIIDLGSATLKKKERELTCEIEMMGPVNMKAIEEFESLRKEFEDFRKNVDMIIAEKNAIEESVRKIEEKKLEVFNRTLEKISKHFTEVYREFSAGGEGCLRLDDPRDTETGLMLMASPPGKKLLNIDSQSGGERALTALSFLFAIQRIIPTPFYLLDEIDASLDGINSRRVLEIIKRDAKEMQFIMITHNDELMRGADQLYGVSMEGGESKIMGIKLPEEKLADGIACNPN
jgi:chromosome segregation protein